MKPYSDSAMPRVPALFTLYAGITAVGAAWLIGSNALWSYGVFAFGASAAFVTANRYRVTKASEQAKPATIIDLRDHGNVISLDARRARLTASR